MTKTLNGSRQFVGDGHPGPGRPKGSRDKKWANLEYWYGLVINEWKDLKPTDRAWIAMAAFKALLGRAQIPLTSEESVQNVNRALATLKMLEEAGQIVANNAGREGSDLSRVENGAVKVQVTA